MMFRQEVNDNINAALVTAVSVGRGFEKISELKDYLLSGIWHQGKTNNIRIDKGNLMAQHKGQKVDHVVITYDGNIIDNTGKNYIRYDDKAKAVYKIERRIFDSGKKSIEYGFDIRKDINKPTKHPDSHIAADIWKGWKSFHKPD